MVAWSAWRTDEWLSRTALALGLVGSAGALAEGLLARLFRCAAIAGIAGLLASWLGTGLGSNLLLIQVQPWRMLWITQLCSWLALAWLIAGYWHGGRVLRALLLALCLAALARDSIGGAVGLLAGAALAVLASRPPLQWPRWGNRAAFAGLALLGTAWVWSIARASAKTFLASPAQEPAWQAIQVFFIAVELGGGAAAGTLLLLLVWRWSGSQRKATHLGAFALAFSSLCLALVFACYPSHRQYDLSPGGARAVQAAFLPLIPQQAVVYWQNNVRVSWFQLHRSNYASNTQLAGVAFNRGTAIEGARRMERLARLGGEDAVPALNSLEARIRARRLPAADWAGLQFACADPGLDFVVLSKQIGRAAIARAADTEYGTTYYLYDCGRLRARPAAGT
jgi:hypothetical protein